MSEDALATVDDVSAEVSRSARQERRRVLIAGAAVVLLFYVADTMALRRLDLTVLCVRIAWAAAVLAGAQILPRVSEAAGARVIGVLAVSSGIFFCVLAQLVGGVQGGMFGWILAFPVVIAVSVQDHPAATLGGAIACLLGGVAIQRAALVPWPAVAAWSVESAGLSALAVYASVIYERLRARERSLIIGKVEALQRAARYEAERKLRLRLEEAVRGRDEFLSIASHELRTPLTALDLSLQGVLRVLAQQAPAQAAALGPRVQQVVRQVQRLGKLVDNLLDSTRIAAGLPLQREAVDLAALAQESVARFREQADVLSVRLELSTKGVSVGSWDRMRLEQVLANLVSNALKYGAGQPVSLRVEGLAQTALLAVEDHGIGIPPQDLTRIFGRFERAEAARSYGGLGLGLWICKGIVEAHGGTLRVESEPGKGSTFTVELPKEPPRSDPPPRAAGGAPSPLQPPGAPAPSRPGGA